MPVALASAILAGQADTYRLWASLGLVKKPHSIREAGREWPGNRWKPGRLQGGDEHGLPDWSDSRVTSFVTCSAAPIATGWSDKLPGGNCTH